MNTKDNPEIETIPGSARQTVALAIRRRQMLQEEARAISDLALRISVAFTGHRTCFNEFSDMGCTGCEDIVQNGLWVDAEMDRADIPRESRTLPYPTRQEHE